MPLTPRDRRTLMIGGGILGFLLVAFFLFNNLSGGGDDGAIPTLPPITTGPGWERRWRRQRNPDGLALERDQPAAGVHRPRSVLDPAGAVASGPDEQWQHCSSPSGSVTTSPTQSGSTTPTTTPPSTPGGNSSLVLGGKTVVLLDTFKGGTRAQFEVDGTVYNVGIGDTFGGGSFELQSINGDCATFLYGDEPFTLCANSTK